ALCPIRWRVLAWFLKTEPAQGSVAELDPPPTPSPLTADPNSMVSADWTRWYLALWGTVAAQPVMLGTPVSKSGQTVGIPATPFPLPALTGGMIRVSWYIRITAAAATSGSVQLLINYSEGGQPLVLTAAVMPNTLNFVQASSVPLVVDQATPISYQISYASNPANTLKYNLGLRVEQM